MIPNFMYNWIKPGITFHKNSHKNMSHFWISSYIYIYRGDKFVKYTALLCEYLNKKRVIVYMYLVFENICRFIPKRVETVVALHYV